ncbi:MAG: retropepsin-like aspartic protease family protein [Hyphomicrobiaceae bacterium]
MALSSGSKTALGEAASWGIAGIMLVGTFVYFDELKAMFSPALHQNSNPTHLQGVAGSQKRAPATARQPMKPRSAGYVVELAAGAYGHYKTPARVNGRQINVLVDTGASYVALTHEDAERAGVFVSNSDYKYKTRTANGMTRVALVTIDRISIGEIEVRNVKASVHERGKLHVTLLGMSFLGKLRRAEMRSGRLILEN